MQLAAAMRASSGPLWASRALEAALHAAAAHAAARAVPTATPLAIAASFASAAAGDWGGGGGGGSRLIIVTLAALLPLGGEAALLGPVAAAPAPPRLCAALARVASDPHTELWLCAGAVTPAALVAWCGAGLAETLGLATEWGALRRHPTDVLSRSAAAVGLCSELQQHAPGWGGSNQQEAGCETASTTAPGTLSPGLFPPAWLPWEDDEPCASTVSSPSLCSTTPGQPLDTSWLPEVAALIQHTAERTPASVVAVGIASVAFSWSALPDVALGARRAADLALHLGTATLAGPNAVAEVLRVDPRTLVVRTRGLSPAAFVARLFAWPRTPAHTLVIERVGAGACCWGTAQAWTHVSGGEAAAVEVLEAAAV